MFRVRSASSFFYAVLVQFAIAVPAMADISDQEKPCTDSQSTIVNQALADAKAAIGKAIDSFKAPSSDDLARQQKWFGALSSDTAAKIQNVYETSLAQASFAQFWCPLSNDLSFKWDVGDLAAVSPDEAPGAIFLTPSFFDLGTSGKDSQMGTFIHELSHLVGIGLHPEVYGTDDALKLASSDPVKAKNNSDNYQYYVEDLIFGISTASQNSASKAKHKAS